MTRRFQFTLRSLLVAMLVMAAFFGGMAVQRRLDMPISHKTITLSANDEVIERFETMVLRDGTTWHRELDSSGPKSEMDNRVPGNSSRQIRRAAAESDGSTRRHPLFTYSKTPNASKREMVQKRRAEQMARDNPHLPQSQQFLPQPDPTK